MTQENEKDSIELDVKPDFDTPLLENRQDFCAYQSPQLSSFMALRKKSGQKGTINNKPVELFNDGNYQLQLDYDKLRCGLNINTNKFLLFVLKKTSRQIPSKTPLEDINSIDRTIIIKQKEIKEFFGIKDKKHAKDIMISSSQILLHSNHTFTFTRYNKKQISCETGFNMTILDKYDYRNGVVKLQFSDNFLRYIPQQYIAQYPNNIGQYSDTAYQITRYICELYRIQQIKKRENCVLISIEKLLEKTNTIPTICELNDSNDRHYNREIVEPLDRAIDEIESYGYFKSIYYCNLKSKPLTGEQLKCGEYMKYKNFKTLSVIFIFHEYDKSQVNESIKKQKLFK
ncbi:hypothetical protein AGMMS49936_08150 [Endomicrobiia bacterium]|nr:hypothetical protein AGMMS49936_08150 [Endomicrobiia bacterium]